MEEESFNILKSYASSFARSSPAGRDLDAESLVRSSDPQHPSNLICELCRKFYTLGWVSSL